MNLHKKYWIPFLLGVFFLSSCSLLETNTKEPQKDESKPVEEQVVESDLEAERDSDAIILPEEYFNQIEQIDGKATIINTDNLVQLVNKENYLPAYFKPADLITVPGVHFALPQNKEIHQMREQAANAVVKMFADGKGVGLQLSLRSAFRSYETQELLFANEVKSLGEEEAVKWVAAPGTSEHQTGLALDLTSKSNGYQLGESFEETEEFGWLKANAHQYGFILRYPKGFDEITGYYYEPWHWRYVGAEVASDMNARGIATLEEYIAQAKRK